MVNAPVKITYTPLHPTFGAEVDAGTVDFDNFNDETMLAIKEGLAKYGAIMFRSTGLDDARHVALSSLFGPLDDVKPYITGLGQINRLPFDELFDVSNVDPDGKITQPGSKRDILARCNTEFHVDSAFNPRRAGISLLLAHELPPAECGGDTEFSDTRTAYDDLEPETKEKIKDWVINNSQFHCRRTATPGHPILQVPEYDPLNNRFGLHKLVQVHEPSGRTNLYIAAHAHSVVGMSIVDGQREIKALQKHCADPKYTFRMKWKNPGDLLIWDNTNVAHRAVPGTYEGKFRRDLRRTTVHDTSSQAWGLNEVGATWRSGLP
ncbi:putative 2,4-dichlorophenoxyacetate alpha-ketoglutarate dioxygenase [Meredithblackwellia eburnea MCA 4105]